MSEADVYTESKQVDEERESKDKRLQGKCHTSSLLHHSQGYMQPPVLPGSEHD